MPPSERRRVSPEAAAWLVEALTEAPVPPPGLPRPRRPPDLEWAAQHHGVEAWAYRRLAALDMPREVMGHAVHAAQARHQRAMAELRLASAALDRAHVDHLVVKGPALVASCYPAGSLRSYVDLDLLVNPRDLPEAVRALEDCGFRMLEANWPLLAKSDVRELRLLGPTGGCVDLHWSIGRGAFRQDTSPPFEVLKGRGVVLALDGLSFPALGPVDMLVHTAVHAADSGGHRLVWMADIRGALDAVERAGVPAEDVISVVDAWGARLAVAVMLNRAVRLLHVQVPLSLRAMTRFAPWPTLVALSDALSPPAQAGTCGSLSRLAARSCRRSTATSLVAFIGKAVQWGTGNREGPPTADELNNPDDPRSALFPAGEASAAHTFLERAALQRRGR